MCQVCLSTLKPVNTIGKEEEISYSLEALLWIACVPGCFLWAYFMNQSRKANKSFNSLTIGSLMSSGFYFTRTVTNVEVLGYWKFQLGAKTERCYWIRVKLSSTLKRQLHCSLVCARVDRSHLSEGRTPNPDLLQILSCLLFFPHQHRNIGLRVILALKSYYTEPASLLQDKAVVKLLSREKRHKIIAMHFTTGNQNNPMRIKIQKPECKAKIKKYYCLQVPRPVFPPSSTTLVLQACENMLFPHRSSGSFFIGFIGLWGGAVDFEQERRVLDYFIQ